MFFSRPKYMSPGSEAKVQVVPRTPSAECWRELGHLPGENGRFLGWPAPPMLSEGLCPPHLIWEYHSTLSRLTTLSKECFPPNPLPSPGVAWTWLSAMGLQSCTRVQCLHSELMAPTVLGTKTHRSMQLALSVASNAVVQFPLSSCSHLPFSTCSPGPPCSCNLR